jgi:hypothetical protein
MSTDTVIQIPVELDKVTFRRFATFDTIRRQHRWRLPVWFFLIMTAISVYLFLQTDKAQSGLLGGVMLAVGLSLPVIYFTSFYNTLRENTIKYCLPRQVYTLRLSDSDVHIQSDVNKAEEQTVPWDMMYAAYRARDAVYLYALPTKAFLLPSGQADVPDDELWAFIEEKMPKGKCRSLRRK